MKLLIALAVLLCSSCAFASFGELVQQALSDPNAINFQQSYFCNKTINTTLTRNETYVGTCPSSTGFFSFGFPGFGTVTCIKFRLVNVTASVEIKGCCEGYAGDMCQYPLRCEALKITDVGLNDVVIIDVTAGTPTPTPQNANSIPGITLGMPWGLCYDFQNFLCFWNDKVTGYIYMANFSSGTAGPYFDLGAATTSVEGLACDPHTMKLYFTDNTNRHIATLDYPVPGAVTPILNDTNYLNMLKNPRAIEIVNLNGIKKVYFTDYGIPAFIGRMDIDGSNAEKLVENGVSGLVGWPNGITFDVPGNKMYWTDGQGGWIGSANLDGTSPMTPFISGAGGAFYQDIQLLGDYLYITSATNTFLQYVPKTGGIISNFGVTGFVAPVYISLVCFPDTAAPQLCCCPGYHGPHCNTQCPSGRVWNPCGSQCERTCDVLDPCGGTCGGFTPTCAQDCTEGCICPANMVRHQGICQLEAVCASLSINAMEEFPVTNCLRKSPCGQNSNGKYRHRDPQMFVECTDGACSIGRCAEAERFFPHLQMCGDNDFNRQEL